MFCSAETKVNGKECFNPAQRKKKKKKERKKKRKKERKSFEILTNDTLHEEVEFLRREESRKWPVAHNQFPLVL